MQTLTLPDIDRQRRDIFLSSGAQNPGRNVKSAGAILACQPEVFSGHAFPKFEYLDPARVKELIGSYTIKTEYYNAEFQTVEEAAAPGRYGAIAVVSNAAGDSFTAYRTLYNAADAIQPGSSACLLAETDKVSGVKVDEFDAAKADQDWWHALRKKLGTALKYERYVHLPADYEADPARRWPVVYYLHGTGGGNVMKDVESDGIQISANENPQFPNLSRYRSVHRTSGGIHRRSKGCHG